MNPTQLHKVVEYLRDIIDTLNRCGVAAGDLENILRVISTETDEQVINEALQWLRSATGPRGLPDIYLSDEMTTWLGKISLLRNAVDVILPRSPLNHSAKKLLKKIRAKGSASQ